MRIALLTLGCLVLPLAAQRNPAWPWRGQGPVYGKLSRKERAEIDAAVRPLIKPPAKTCSLPPDKPEKMLPLVRDRVTEEDFVEPWPAGQPVKLHLEHLQPAESARVLFPQRRRWGATYKNNGSFGRPTAIWGPDDNYLASAEKLLTLVDGEIALSECQDGRMSEPLGIFPPLPKSADATPPRGVMPRCEGTCRFLGPVMHDGMNHKFVLVGHGRLGQHWWLGFTGDPGLASLTRADAPCKQMPGPPEDYQFELGDWPAEDSLPGMPRQAWSVRCLHPQMDRFYGLGPRMD